MQYTSSENFSCQSKTESIQTMHAFIEVKTTKQMQKHRNM